MYFILLESIMILPHSSSSSFCLFLPLLLPGFFVSFPVINPIEEVPLFSWLSCPLLNHGAV